MDFYIHFHQLEYLVNNFLYSLSKELIDCWSFSYCFLSLIYFCITISKITFLPIDNPHSVAVDIGIAINPTLLSDKLLEMDFAVIITNVSNDFDIVVISF